MSRHYYEISQYGPNFCDKKDCVASAEWYVAFEVQAEDDSLPKNYYGENYYCDEHLPDDARKELSTPPS